MYLAYESEHYVFHFKSGSAAQRDLQLISDCQEACFKKITDALHVIFPAKFIIGFAIRPRKWGAYMATTNPAMRLRRARIVFTPYTMTILNASAPMKTLI